LEVLSLYNGPSFLGFWEVKLTTRNVLIAGASGLVGRSILDGLLADESVLAVHVLSRRDIACVSGKLTTHVVDFCAIPSLPPIDEVYLSLGTTIDAAGSQAAFRAVDFDANLAVARAALAAGAKHAGVVSAMGADPNSRVFYNRVKGELEDAVGALPFTGVVFARPSLLMGDRAALGQPTRASEKFGAVVGRILGPLVPRDYRPIFAADVACALLDRVPHSLGREVMRSASISIAAKRYRVSI
jgi:uncharacterized protein YbjT (DUF2867 family)